MMVAHYSALRPLFSLFFSSLAVSSTVRLPGGASYRADTFAPTLPKGMGNSAVLEVVPHSSFLVLL